MIASGPVQSESEDAVQLSATQRWFRRLGMCALNAWLIMHLTAIFTAPATVGPSSQVSRDYWEMVGPYLQFLYLNHGFHYFAPQPGSSNLLRWSATRSDGTEVTGEFPNFDIKPRLYYHRHFMLSEYLGNSDPELQTGLAVAYAGNLMRAHDADEVSLTIVRHDLPTMARIRAGGSVNDEDLFEETPLGIFTRQTQEDQTGSQEQ